MNKKWSVAAVIVVFIIVVLTWQEYGAYMASHIILFGMFGMVVAGVYLYGLGLYRKRGKKQPHEEETQKISARTSRKGAGTEDLSCLVQLSQSYSAALRGRRPIRSA